MKARIIQTLHGEFITATVELNAGSAHQRPDVRRRCDPGGMPGNLHFI